MEQFRIIFTILIHLQRKKLELWRDKIIITLKRNENQRAKQSEF